MNRLSICVHAGFAELLIDGRPLLDLVRDFEVQWAEAEGHPSLAGAYAYLPTSEVLPPASTLLGSASDGYQYDDSVTLLDCDCGVPGCWPLTARIHVSDSTVTWHGFAQQCRLLDSAGLHWDYSCFGPFVFQRQAYETALHAAAPPSSEGVA